jgi:hypothetical protein
MNIEAVIPSEWRLWICHRVPQVGSLGVRRRTRTYPMGPGYTYLKSPSERIRRVLARAEQDLCYIF